MKHWFSGAIAAAILCLACASAQDTASFQGHMTQAQEAFQNENWTALNEHLDAAQALRPYSLYIWKNRILARELAGHTDEAMSLAETIAARGLSMTMTGHKALESLAASPAFAPIAQRMDANMSSKGDANAVVSLHNTDLLPEAITRDDKGNVYVGAVRTGQILRITPEGESRGVAFAPGGVFDVEVRDDDLWAVVNNQLAFEMADPDNAFASVMIFDLKTGAASREIRVAEDDALLGDLEVAKNGAAYASDSITPRVFKMAPKGETLDVFAADPRLVNPQGIALDEKNDRLFLADYLAGIFSIDTKTGAVTQLENAADAHLGGIDGLYLYEGDLIGVQNGTTPQRIVRLNLNEEGTSVTGLTVLAQNIADWNEPTHGVVDDDEFHYIATSNWPSYDSEWNVAEGATLQALKIMSVELD